MLPREGLYSCLSAFHSVGIDPNLFQKAKDLWGKFCASEPCRSRAHKGTWSRMVVNAFPFRSTRWGAVCIRSRDLDIPVLVLPVLLSIWPAPFQGLACFPVARWWKSV